MTLARRRCTKHLAHNYACKRIRRLQPAQSDPTRPRKAARGSKQFCRFEHAQNDRLITASQDPPGPHPESQDGPKSHPKTPSGARKAPLDAQGGGYQIHRHLISPPAAPEGSHQRPTGLPGEPREPPGAHRGLLGAPRIQPI